MANKKAAQKALRNNEKRELKNKMRVSSVKTALKKVTSSLAEGASKQEVDANFSHAVSQLHQAAKKNVIHKRTAARKISRFAKKINKAMAIKAEQK